MKRNKGGHLAYRETFFPGRLGIRGKIQLYLLVLALFLISLVWLFQSALLYNLYTGARFNQIRSTASLLIRNIDHEDLQILAARLGEDNDLSILLLDEAGQELFSAGRSRYSAFHELTTEEIRALAARAPEDGRPLEETVNAPSSADVRYDRENYEGNAPEKPRSAGKSCNYVQRVTFSDGQTGTLLINARMTPVRSTLETMRWQFFLIVGTILLATLLVGNTMAKSVSQPIIETNQAARELRNSRYARPPHSGGYREIAELNDTLVQTAEDLRKVEDLQRELIANISHDLRTPLTMIEGYAEVMRDIPDEVTPENMQTIIDETNRLSSMVNEVLDFSRLRSGSLEMNRADFNLTRLIREICGRISKMTEADGYVLVPENTEKEAWANGDPGRISQVIYNLIGNALTYTGADKTVTVRQELRAETVRVEVRDSGEGIAPEELPYIWDRYYRSRDNHRRAVIGSGLGLNICRGILENHHVNYGADSELGRGTVFWFELPRAEKPQEQTEEPDA